MTVALRSVNTIFSGELQFAANSTTAREKLTMSACAWRGLYRATTAVIRGFGSGGPLPNTDLLTLYDKQGMDLF